jgi:hypothetical protein
MTGEQVISGSQRIHERGFFVKRAAEYGIDIDHLLDNFRFWRFVCFTSIKVHPSLLLQHVSLFSKYYIFLLYAIITEMHMHLRSKVNFHVNNKHTLI